MSQSPGVKGRRILVTGGLGFIGSNLVCRCVELGARVTIYDSLDGRAGGSFHNLTSVRDAVTVVIDDIRNRDAVAATMSGQDVVFHCAGYTSHAGSMAFPFDDLDVNCKGTLNILEAARRSNPDVRLVQLGTSTQVGKMRSAPVDENHPEFPLDVYSAHKSLAEKYFLIYGKAYGLATSVVRLSNVFGPRAHIRTNQFGFINYFVGLALQDKDLTVFGDGRQVRNVIYVDDCVSALLLVAERPEATGQVFFVTGDEQYSIKQIAEGIVEAMGRGRVRPVEWPSDKAAIEVGDAVISNQRIKEILGWRPRHTLVTGLVATRDYFRSCLDQYLG